MLNTQRGAGPSRKYNPSVKNGVIGIPENHHRSTTMTKDGRLSSCCLINIWARSTDILIRINDFSFYGRPQETELDSRVPRADGEKGLFVS